MKRSMHLHFTNKRQLKIYLGWLMEKPSRRWLHVIAITVRT